MRLGILTVLLASVAALSGCSGNAVLATASAPTVPDNRPSSIDRADQQTLDGAKVRQYPEKEPPRQPLRTAALSHLKLR